MEQPQIVVSERALIARINRKLSRAKLNGWNGSLKRSRPGSRMENNVGRYYVVDNSNTVRDHSGSHLAMEWLISFANAQGCLGQNERVEMD